MDKPVHVKVYSVGRCTKCNHYAEVMIHDYGRMLYRKLEDAMDDTNHQVRPIQCTKCSTAYPPERFIYRDQDSRKDILQVNIDYGGAIDPEIGELMQEGHKRRYEIYQDQERAFWGAYVEYALEDWRAAVGELLRSEIETGAAAIGLTASWKTEQQARREVAAKVVTEAERSSFWRAANVYFIQEEILYIGAMGWTPDLYAKMYGAARTRFAIMYFPIAPALEDQRTKYIGQLFRREKGDNAFLLRWIGQLTEDIQKKSVQSTALMRESEKQKHELAGLRDKLGAANERIRGLEQQNQPSEARSQEDQRRIRELKSFIGELMGELRQLRPDEKPADAGEPPELREAIELGDTVDDLSKLAGKTLAIIGGNRRRSSGDYPCRILTHNADKLDPDFYASLDQADVIAVLTRFISHAAMWEAKAYAIDQGKYIFYPQETNVNRIVSEAARII
ncbi:hypothetical protein B9T62_15510 [Paenibacillus donghaensis]|uniref:DUF2325 domain-containing protein n=2 Tax=Paenibacillus donghaensis TaxID=414771 RepID=A0A2Z2KP83_9BACL|nr:hypothetical protein B9T62_15510 [Paenibacillus donghaensis]